MNLRNVHGHSHGYHYQQRTRRSLIASQRTAQSEILNLGASESLGLEARHDTMHIMARMNNVNEKPSGDPNTTTIAISVVIPLIAAIVGLAYFARKGVVRRRREEQANKYKSMDFGLQETTPAQSNKRRSAFFGKEKDSSHKSQLSMDMNLSSPYLLPPNLQTSRESFNSLSKTLHPNDDPYRHIAEYAGSDVGSLQSFQRGHMDRTSSIYTSRTRSGDGPYPPHPISLQAPAPVAQPRIHSKGQERQRLSNPVKNEFRFVEDGPTVARVPEIQEPPVAVTSDTHKPMPHNSRPSSLEPKDEHQPMVAEIVNQNTALPQFEFFNNSEPVASPKAVPPAGNESTSVTRTPQQQSNDEKARPHAAGLAVPGRENKRLSVGLRPLPPDDFLESDDPEFRANRIRSFYKEYFEDGKPDQNAPPMPPLRQHFENFDQGPIGDAPYFDPETNSFVMPYAQPVTRRAMTPPPNNRRPMLGPSQRGQPGPRGPHGGSATPSGLVGRPRAGSAMSIGGWGARSPRPGSSASNLHHSGQPKKPIPPPSPLTSLPTPSKLKEDTFVLMGAVDFAPPPTIKDQAAGRSQSPLGERLPYKPHAPAHSPLMSAFEDTAVLPSPHSLRKSGAFTGLDFAPPRRFKDPEGPSETGSVQSAQSGISGPGLNAIRAGAGRISRLPGDVVFTQSAINETLKPNWDMNNNY
ncbi:hypothetical protein GGS21DRAFT_539907 [Xylaria nigripes]|nr:hypothetical protein GGS21DRAFT_539907 [Xylaria nigripes]